MNARLEKVSNTKFIRGSASALPFETAGVDCVVSCLTFHEVRDVREKEDCLREAFRVLKPGGLACINIGDAATAQGDSVRAVRLYLAAKYIFDSIGVWRQDHEAELEEKLALSRAALSETDFAEAEAQGRAMTMEQAIEMALRTTN